MRKVKLKVKIIAGAIMVTTAIAASNIYKINAMNEKNISGNEIQLNVEKQDRDTIKIYLSNFSDLAKSLQLSVKIDEGNVKFVENSIKWLMNNDENNIITDYKIDSSKKVLDLFIVSKEPINTDGGVIELCEIDVSKDESILDKILKTKDFSYKVVPNVIDGEAYSYVRYSTNKRIGGEDIINADEDKLVISNEPIIKLKDNQYVINNKIVIEKGTNFVIGNYLEAFDVDGNEIENIEYSGDLDTDTEGSYNIECTATDSNGNKTTLKVTVEVKDSINIDNSKPDDSNTDDSKPDDSNDEKPSDILDIINEEVVKIISGDGTSSAPIMVETLENTSTVGFAEFLANVSEFEIKYGSYEEHNDYKVVNLTLGKKKVREAKSNTNNNGYKHLKIKVYNSNDDLINILNNFIVQNNIKEVIVSDNTNNSSKPGSSNGSSKPSNSKDEVSNDEISNDNNVSEENDENITEDNNDSGQNIENNNNSDLNNEVTSNDDYVNGGSNSINNNANNVVNSNSVSSNNNNQSNNAGMTNNTSNNSNNSEVSSNNPSLMQEYSELEKSRSEDNVSTDSNNEENDTSKDKEEESSEYRNDENLAHENEDANDESENKLSLNKKVTFGVIIATIVAGFVWLLLYSNKRTK